MNRIFKSFCFFLASLFVLSRLYSLPPLKSKSDSANFKNPLGVYFAFTGTYSSVDVYKNYLQNPYRLGYSPRLYWEFSNAIRLCGEATFLPSFTYLPSWEKLSAVNLELNLHFMARIKDEHSIFYATAGLCQHAWRGNFIAQSVFYDEIVNYKPGTTISKTWLGINAGVGIERAFKHFDLFAEYRYRFSKVDAALAVSDVAVYVGVKRKIPFKKIFRGLKDRYSWF